MALSSIKGKSLLDVRKDVGTLWVGKEPRGGG